MHGISEDDLAFLRRAIQLALEAERSGNLPIGAVITLDGSVIAEGGNAILSPHYHPGRHAEMQAFTAVPIDLWPRSREMTCYTTLEPCVMCAGAILLHGIGRVVYGAADRGGGGKVLLAHLPEYYAKGGGVPDWHGPILPEECDPLYERARRMFDDLPCGNGYYRSV